MPNINGIDAVFQRLLSGHQILITNGRTDACTDAQTGVTLNAPPPFFEWHKIAKTLCITHIDDKGDVLHDTVCVLAGEFPEVLVDPN